MRAGNQYFANACVYLEFATPRPDPQYQDGDPIIVFTSAQIRERWARVICFENMPQNPDGLRPLDSLVRLAWFENRAALRFERIAANQWRRTDLATSQQTVVNGNCQAYIDNVWKDRNGLIRPTHCVFGTLGAEVVYENERPLTNASMTSVWTVIEAMTSHRDENYLDWPANDMELCRCLWLRITDMTDAEVMADMAVDAGRNRKRIKTVAWRTVNGVGHLATAITNPQTKVDLRPVITLNRSATIKTKI